MAEPIRNSRRFKILTSHLWYGSQRKYTPDCIPLDRLRFGILAVDAFSGDAIPAHLLTREAFRLYWRHLKQDRVLAVHVSSKYLSLGPVVAMGAVENQKRAMMVDIGGIARANRHRIGCW
jgi:hypothetical protein